MVIFAFVSIKLRHWDINDLASLVKHANNPNIAKFMTDVFSHPYTEESGKKFIAFTKEENKSNLWAIEYEGEKLLVELVCIH